MKSSLSNILLATAIMGMGTPSEMPRRRKVIINENGNSRRTHKENVKRRKMRKLTKKAISINRKN